MFRRHLCLDYLLAKNNGKDLSLTSAVSVAGRSLRITLVEDAAEYLQVKRGDKVAFILAEDGRVYIRKA